MRMAQDVERDVRAADERQRPLVEAVRDARSAGRSMWSSIGPTQPTTGRSSAARSSGGGWPAGEALDVDPVPDHDGVCAWARRSAASGSAVAIDASQPAASAAT